MKSVKVKICGIRSLESAQASIDAGADFLGFNFVKSSKRYIEPERALAMIKDLGLKIKENVNNKVKFVGVFQNQPRDEVNEISEELNLDYVQLHGSESSDYIRQIKKPVIKVININDVILVSSERAHPGSLINNRNDERDSGQVLRQRAQDSRAARMTSRICYYLLDRNVQGIGDMVDLEQAAKIAKEYPVFLAGGLTPENVAQVAKKVRPFAVDVASGVETQGRQDLEKIKKFIYNAKNYEAI